jgi:hypothetical protein
MSSRLACLLALLALPGCAPTFRMPAVTADPAWASTTTWEPPTSFAQSAPEGYFLRRDRDPSRKLTRLTVTTHYGVYTGWVQKPQISFYVQFGGEAPEVRPGLVALLFRTLEPEALTSNRLELGCQGSAEELPVTPRSELERTGSVPSHFLTYLLPADAVGRFAGCEEGTLSVGQLRARFTGEQLAALQALLRAAGPAALFP